MTLRQAFILILTAATLALAVQQVLSAVRQVPPDPQLPSLETSLATIELSPRQHVAGYNRKEFGEGWGPSRNPDFQGCDSRRAVLAFQATVPVSCTKAPEAIIDPYAGKVLALPSPAAAQVDHVFPLSAAWDMGAWAWDGPTRQAFANDPLNLIATTAAINQDKSDKLPGDWMPPAAASRCWYSQRLAAVAATYALHLSAADARTMRRACWLSDLTRHWLQ